MAKIQNDAQIITYSASYDMTERKSALKNSVQRVVTMEDIKDDIREAYIPYEYIYRTMLTQVDTGDVKERLLNFRDSDFFQFTLGTNNLLSFTRTAIGVYSTPAHFEDLDMTLLSFTPRFSKTSSGEIYVEIDSDSLVITTFDTAGEPSDGVLEDFVLEFRYRIRGANFVAISATTNAAGNEVLITMSELINAYGLDAAGLLDSFVIESGESVITNSLISYDDDVLTVSFGADPALTSESGITISFDAANNVESVYLGLLEAFDDLSVENIIPEEEE